MRPALAAVVLLAGCASGPAASDAALCRDVIHRLCITPVCASVTMKLAPTGDCETTLTARTPCGSESFMFSGTLDRATFLDCRLPLLRNGDNVNQPPDCLDVDEMFTNCPAVVQLLGGTP
jgi:hypothetical protein